MSCSHDLPPKNTAIIFVLYDCRAHNVNYLIVRYFYCTSSIAGLEQPAEILLKKISEETADGDDDQVQRKPFKVGFCYEFEHNPHRKISRRKRRRSADKYAEPVYLRHCARLRRVQYAQKQRPEYYGNTH